MIRKALTGDLLVLLKDHLILINIAVFMVAMFNFARMVSVIRQKLLN